MAKSKAQEANRKRGPSVTLDASVVEGARKVAALQGRSASEYLSGRLGPVVAKDLAAAEKADLKAKAKAAAKAAKAPKAKAEPAPKAKAKPKPKAQPTAKP